MEVTALMVTVTAAIQDAAVPVWDIGSTRVENGTLSLARRETLKMSSHHSANISKRSSSYVFHGASQNDRKGARGKMKPLRRLSQSLRRKL